MWPPTKQPVRENGTAVPWPTVEVSKSAANADDDAVNATVARKISLRITILSDTAILIAGGDTNLSSYGKVCYFRHTTKKWSHPGGQVHARKRVFVPTGTSVRPWLPYAPGHRRA